MITLTKLSLTKIDGITMIESALSDGTRFQYPIFYPNGIQDTIAALLVMVRQLQGIDNLNRSNNE